MDKTSYSTTLNDASHSFINDLVRALWPYLKQGVQASACDALETAAQGGAIPCLHDLRLQDLEPFGSHPPVVESSHVHVLNNEPALEATLKWALAPHASLCAGFAPPQVAGAGCKGAPPAAQQGSTWIDPTSRRDLKLKVGAW